MNKKIICLIISNLVISSCSNDLNNIKETNIINSKLNTYIDNDLSGKINELYKIKNQIDESPYNKDLYIKFIESYNEEIKLEAFI
ncbi:MAG: hypothetical protein U0354_05600 [Candidatus Sericytochromatia bacterium]